MICSLKTEQNNLCRGKKQRFNPLKRNAKINERCSFKQTFFGEFDLGSGRTLAACLIHASRADRSWMPEVRSLDFSRKFDCSSMKMTFILLPASGIRLLLAADG